MQQVGGARSNLLFIISDEHQARALSCAGHPIVRTPHIDTLAERGSLFHTAYTPCPICVPARASLATGRYVHEIRYWDNAMAYDGRIPGWGARLQAANVLVESIGKLHYRNREDPTGFDAQHRAMHIWKGIGRVWGSVRDPIPALRDDIIRFDQVGAGYSKYNAYDEAVRELGFASMRTMSAHGCCSSALSRRIFRLLRRNPTSIGIRRTECRCRY